MTPFRLRLKELRLAAGLSQVALSERAGVKRARISEIETGSAQRVDVAMLGKLADALDCQPGDLIERVPKASAKRRRT